tara:strand:+ start:905 stop:1585 length:681 start_codon:yes stop_codon:yes gene_type:complete
MKFEFTTTACVRPNILDQTYSSLSKALVDVDLKTEGTLYINIDPVPDGSNHLIQEEIRIAQSHFHTVHYNIGAQGGNFSTAASWVLNQPKGDYFLNIEDDWLFVKGRLCIEECINKIESDPRDNILQCVLGHIPIERNRIHFPPSVFQTSVIQSILKKFPIPKNANPEKWLIKIKTLKKLVDYNVTCIDGVRVRDNGKSWMRKNNYIKRRRPEDGKGNFTRWEKND